MKVCVFVGVVLACGIGAAQAQQRNAAPVSATAFDVFSDPDGFRNKRVTITGCDLFNAKSGTVNCAVRSPRGAQVGNILVDLKGMDAATRRRVLTDCAGDGSDLADGCEKATITGRFTVKYGVLLEIMSPTVQFSN